jgi:CRISPR/Cas system-associated protein Cas5 (RAMP superfamily)
VSGSAGCDGGSADEGQDGELADEEEEEEGEVVEVEEEGAKRVGKRSCLVSSPIITKGEYVCSSLMSAGSE